MSFKKETEKDCVITSEKLDTNYCQVQDWKKSCAHFYHPPPAIYWEGQKILPLSTNFCVAILWKQTNWKFIFPCRKINWYVLQIGYISVTRFG